MLEKNLYFENKTILVTGTAGFIGYFLTKELLRKNCKVIGLDSMNDYYDIGLKKYRLSEINKMNTHFTFIKGSLADKKLLNELFENIIRKMTSFRFLHIKFTTSEDRNRRTFWIL